MQALSLFYEGEPCKTEKDPILARNCALLVEILYAVSWVLCQQGVMLILRWQKYKIPSAKWIADPLEVAKILYHMAIPLNLDSIVSAYKSNNQSDIKCSIQLEKCTQSIYRWNQYCIYHYGEIKKATDSKILFFDRISANYTRGGDDVSVRFVYEANLIAFLNCLHAMLDSFPFLLHTYSPKGKIRQSRIKWELEFVKRYKETNIHQELFNFLIDEKFNQVKGLVNAVKHQNLIRIGNTGKDLFIEEFNYKQPSGDDRKYLEESHPSTPAIVFLSQAYDELIPRFFSLCASIIYLK